MATVKVPFTNTGFTTTTTSIKFPEGVTEATIHLWGSGGPGGGCPSSVTGGGGGGAGGQYVKSVITVDDETTYTLRVGGRRSGNTGTALNGFDTDWETDVIVAKGGASGQGFNDGAAGASGSTAGGVGDVVYAGGNGSDGDGATASGAGGGGAGTTGAGGNASGTTAGTGTSEGGGNGGAGRTTAGSGLTGLSHGGGGSGGLNTATTDRHGGSGGGGGAIIEFEYDTVEISSWEELAAIQEGGSLFMHLDYILIKSLDKDSTGYSTYASSTANSGSGWKPIGGGSMDSVKFYGTFDGQLNTIGDLYINAYGPIGLFARTEGATVKNIGVVDCDITSTGAWFSSDGVGALVGTVLTNTVIEKCWSTGAVSGIRLAGGLAGPCGGTSTIKQCWSSVDVYGSNSWGNIAGGLSAGLGYNTIENCYSKGSVETEVNTNRRGGLSADTTHATVINCYTISPTTPTGGSNGGGMVGYKSGTVTDTRNFYDTTATGWNTSEIGTGKTTAEMKDKDTYTDWDFDEVWDIRPDRNDGYPYLRWEYPYEEEFTFQGASETDSKYTRTLNPGLYEIEMHGAIGGEGTGASAISVDGGLGGKGGYIKGYFIWPSTADAIEIWVGQRGSDQGGTGGWGKDNGGNTADFTDGGGGSGGGSTVVQHENSGGLVLVADAGGGGGAVASSFFLPPTYYYWGGGGGARGGSGGTGTDVNGSAAAGVGNGGNGGDSSDVEVKDGGPGGTSHTTAVGSAKFVYIQVDEGGSSREDGHGYVKIRAVSTVPISLSDTIESSSSKQVGAFKPLGDKAFLSQSLNVALITRFLSEIYLSAKSTFFAGALLLKSVVQLNSSLRKGVSRIMLNILSVAHSSVAAFTFILQLLSKFNITMRVQSSSGWRVASNEDWCQLEMHLGMSWEDAHGTLEDRGADAEVGARTAGSIELWEDGALSNSTFFGESTFNAQPIGRRGLDPLDSFGEQSFYWTFSGEEEESHSMW